MISFENNFYKIINKDILFEKNPKIAVAVSGGPDSICLVFLLKKWLKKKKGKLIAIIVDHQIRSESSKESKLVKNYLFKNNIESVILKISKDKILDGKMSVARSNRYSKIINYCNKKNIFHLFVAHHKDDNIETFVLRKIAGSNIEGLNSIKFKKFYKKIQVLRPLIFFSKNQIYKYIKENNLYFVQDPSNNNTKFSRAVVRNFFKENPIYLKNVHSEFKQIKDNYLDYKKIIFVIFNKLCTAIYKNKIVINKDNFIKLDKEIQSKFFEIIYKYLNPNRPFIRYKKIVKVLGKINNFKGGVVKISNMNIENNLNKLFFSQEK